MRATSQVAEPSPSYRTASESGVRSRRCVYRCFATEPRIPTAKHCGMFRRETRGACVRQSGGPARRFRHQTGCGGNQTQTSGGETVADTRGFHRRAGACESRSEGRRCSAGGAGRADPVFQPGNGDTHTNPALEHPPRFRLSVPRRHRLDTRSGSIRLHIVPAVNGQLPGHAAAGTARGISARDEAARFTPASIRPSLGGIVPGCRCCRPPTGRRAPRSCPPAPRPGRPRRHRTGRSWGSESG